MSLATESNKCNLAIFASGTGSNFINIYRYILNEEVFGEIKLLISNNPKCKAVEFAEKQGIKCKIINQTRFNDNVENIMLQTLVNNSIDLIVLAGYMKKIPENIVNAYQNKILNIHPSLLPKFGGQGFYGLKVHKAVIDSKENHTGITIHFVDNGYDTGNIIYQEKINVMDNDTPETLSKRVLRLEHKNYPQIIKKICQEYKKELH